MEHLSVFRTWGQWVAGPRSKWVTLFLWIVIVSALSITAPSVSKVESNNAAELPSYALSVQASTKLETLFPSDAGAPALIVWYRQGGLTQQDLKAVQGVAKRLTATPVPGQKSVAPFQNFPLRALQQSESKDGTTLVEPVVFKSDASSTTLKDSLAQIRTTVSQEVGTDPFQTASTATSGLHVRVTGPAGIASDALDLFKHADFALLGATTLLVLVLLMLLYRSPVLAFVPLISVGFAYGAISPILGLLAKHGLIVVDAQSVSIMTVLLFGAGTDYCLFLVARYREALYTIDNKYQAIRQAVGGAAGAVVMSGLTVVVSLLALIVSRYGSDHRFAIPFSLAILIMAISGITLVPALLAILGRASFFPAIPRTHDMWLASIQKKPKRQRRRPPTAQPGRFSRWMGTIVTKRPWTVASTSVIALVILAIFSTQMRFTYNLLASFPTTMPSRQGFTLLSSHFGAGNLAPVEVVIQKTSGARAATDVSLTHSLERLPFIETVSAPSISTKDASYERFQVTLKQDPYSMTAMAEVPTLRQTVISSLAANGVKDASAHAWIGGETASQYDTEQFTLRDTKLVIPLVVGIIALLLLLYLRSIVATVYLIVTVLLSYFAALGAGWIVLHTLMGASAIQGAIPLYAFVFLVALGEDYNIFMVSRIWQARNSVNLKEAIYTGVSKTSSVITSAGLILAGTFAVLASLPIQVLVQFGILTSIGVLLDTFIVRPFVVPSITAILGRAAFWPSKSP